MSLFKRKEASFEDMDSQSQLKRIIEQIGFLEKKLDTVLEELRNRGGSRPSFGGHSQGGPRPFNRDRGGFRGGNGRPRPEGNTRYGGQGPRRYSSGGGGRPFGNDDNRGNFSGGGRPDGMRSNRPNYRPRPHQNHSAPVAPQAAQEDIQPE